MTDFPIEHIGFLGTACFLISYGLVQMGKMDGNGLYYTAINILGCAFILVSLMGVWNFPVLLNNAFSLAVSIIGFYRHTKAKTPKTA